MTNKGGRPRKEIDYEQLEKLCNTLHTGEECASLLGMTYETLNNHLKEDGHGGFWEYYKRNCGYGKSSLRRLQWKSAQAGNVTMQIWLGKQYLGQSDKQSTELTGKEGGPIEISNPKAEIERRLAAMATRIQQEEVPGRTDRGDG